MAAPTVIPASGDRSQKELSQARLRRRLSSRREQLGYSRLHRELGDSGGSLQQQNEEGNTVNDTFFLRLNNASLVPLSSLQLVLKSLAASSVINKAKHTLYEILELCTSQMYFAAYINVSR